MYPVFNDSVCEVLFTSTSLTLFFCSILSKARRRGRRRKKLLDDLKDRRGYFHLKEEALDRTMWRNRFGGGFGPELHSGRHVVAFLHFLAPLNANRTYKVFNSCICSECSAVCRAPYDDVTQRTARCTLCHRLLLAPVDVVVTCRNAVIACQWSVLVRRPATALPT